MLLKTLILNMQVLPIIILLASGAASQDLPIAKPNCLDRCNDIRIPFPFGTDERCYHSYGFRVTCNGSFYNPPRLFWQSSSIEIESILPTGQMRVKQFVAYDCDYLSDGTKFFNNPHMTLPQNFSVNSTANRFTVVGCDAYGFVYGIRPGRNYSTGCTATCVSERDLAEGDCTGSGCCQTSIPKNATTMFTKVGSPNNYSLGKSISPCAYGFVVEQDAFRFFPGNLTSLRNVEKLPMLIDWAIGNATCEEAQKSPEYACKSGNSECSEPDTGYGYRCRCKDGYDGNPYLSDGCQDINECLPGQKKCEHHCVNTVGSFHCRCRRGYRGDGKVPPDGKGCRRDELLIVKIVTGIASGIILLLLAAWLVSIQINRRRLRRLMQKYFVQNGGAKLQKELNERGYSQDMFKFFSKSELEKATNSFDITTFLGKGSFGRVYKGKLMDNTEVAIKIARGIDPNEVEYFVNEVIVLSQINHRNAVKLLGCCFETEAPLLVYEFIINGDLSSYIHESEKARLLNWDMRLKIASETANVLSYLHLEAFPPIIHRDIKSDNILLDRTYTAKVSDFGASRLVPMDETLHSTAVLGTPGYVDPEYTKTRQLTTKSDVYSFGVVLLELLTGKRPITVVGMKEENLVEDFLSMMQQPSKIKSLFQLVDAKIVTKGNEEQIIKVAELAQQCLNPKGEDRPSMKDILQELEKLKFERKSSLVKTEES